MPVPDHVVLALTLLGTFVGVAILVDVLCQ